MELGNGWYCLTTGISTAQNSCAYSSPWYTAVVWALEFTEYEIQTQIFTWPGLLRLGRHCFSPGDNFPCYPLVQSIIIIVHWMLIKYITTIQVKWIFEFVFRTPYIQSLMNTTPVRNYDEPQAHKFCAVDIFLEYHLSSSNISRCQVQSRVMAWFYDSAALGKPRPIRTSSRLGRVT